MTDENIAVTSKQSGDSTELYYAEMEAARNESEAAYFSARSSLQAGGAQEELWRALYRAGYERAFHKLWNERRPVETSDALDAARYRFLRQPGNAIVYAKDRDAWGEGYSGHVRYGAPEQLDAAVDKARAAVKASEPACNGLCQGAMADANCPVHGVAAWLRSEKTSEPPSGSGCPWCGVAYVPGARHFSGCPKHPGEAV